MNVVYVDLSANAEQLSQDSAIAVSDGVKWVCLARSRVKRYLAESLAERYGRRNLQYRLLAALVYLAIADRLGEIRQIVIDKDYSGEVAESAIKNYLMAFVRMQRPDIGANFLRIENVKGSEADRLARAVFQGRSPPDRIATIQEVRRLLEKIEKGRGSPLGT